MREFRTTSPIAFFGLVLPLGISPGFVTITLPFVLTRAGLPVSAVASMVALGLSAYVWRFLWAPVADLTLTLRRWYAIGLCASAATVLLVSLMPPSQGIVLTSLIFLSQVAVTVAGVPVGGLMAHTVAEHKKGRAAGWYQAGSAVGAAIGGGAGVWLASHYSSQLAGTVMSAAMLVSAGALYAVPDVRIAASEGLGERMREIARDFRDMLRSPIALLVMVLVLSPIGVGALTTLWSAVAVDWRASPNIVALVNGPFAGIAGAVGCVLGGWAADRVGRWWIFFGSGTLLALVAVAMALAPHTPFAYGAGAFVYTFAAWLNAAAYSALLLHVVGRGAASTKYAIVGSLGNVPVAYMTAFDGWAHDRIGAGGMLMAEAVLSVGCIVLGLLALRRILIGTTVVRITAATEVVG